MRDKGKGVRDDIQVSESDLNHPGERTVYMVYD